MKPNKTLSKSLITATFAIIVAACTRSHLEGETHTLTAPNSSGTAFLSLENYLGSDTTFEADKSLSTASGCHVRFTGNFTEEASDELSCSLTCTDAKDIEAEIQQQQGLQKLQSLALTASADPKLATFQRKEVSALLKCVADRLEHHHAHSHDECAALFEDL